MKVTKIAKRDRRERVVAPIKAELQKRANKLTAHDKRVKALNKKLRQIEDLIQRRDSGQDLAREQLDKIEMLGPVLAEIDGLLKIQTLKS